jgi:hypothetical protein
MNPKNLTDSGHYSWSWVVSTQNTQSDQKSRPGRADQEGWQEPLMGEWKVEVAKGRKCPLDDDAQGLGASSRLRRQLLCELL